MKYFNKQNLQKKSPLVIALVLLGLASTAACFSAETGKTPPSSENIGSPSAVTTAQQKIKSIQADPGYYYSGAAGAKHRIAVVADQRRIIEQESNSVRVPASQ